MTPRERLTAVVDHLAEHGVGGISLRQLAEAVGTSHRMLIYHFGSRDGLLAEVVAHVEAEQRDVLARVFADAPAVSVGAPGEPDERGLAGAGAYWDAVVTATLRFGGLFFELSAHAIQGRPHAAGLRVDLIGGWLPGLVKLLVHLGVPAETAPAAARLALGPAAACCLTCWCPATGSRWTAPPSCSTGCCSVWSPARPTDVRARCDAGAMPV